MSLGHRLEHFLYRRLLDASLDHELSGRRAARVDQHVHECPMCAAAIVVTFIVKERLALLGR